MKSSLILTLVLILVLLIIPSVDAAYATFNPIDDTWIEENSTATNGVDYDLFVGKNYAPDNKTQSLFEYNISTIPSGAVVTNAVLLFVSRGEVGTWSPYFHVGYVDNSSWNENTTNWFNRPTPENLTSCSTFIGATGNVDINITCLSPYINGKISSTKLVTFLAFFNTTVAGGNYVTLGSKEAALGTQKAILNITYVEFATVYINNPVIPHYPSNQSNFSINVSGNLALDTCILDWNGTNMTMDTTSGSAGIEMNVTDGNYSYGVYCNSTVANGTVFNGTYNILVDTIPPVGEYVFPTPENNTVINVSYTTINVSLTVEYPTEQFVNCTLSFNSEGNFSMTIEPNGKYCYYNKTNISDGAHYFFTVQVDLVNHSETTDVRNIIIDTTPPVIYIYEPESDVVYDTNQIPLTVSVTDETSIVNSVWFSLDSVIYAFVPNATVMVDTPDKVYSLFYCANDTVGNENCTESFVFGYSPVVLASNAKDTLIATGEGLGSMLSSLTNPVVNLIIGLSVAFGIGAFIYALSRSFGGVLGKSQAVS